MISAIILTHNNASTIENAVRSVLPIVQELIIIDDVSTDNTLELVRALAPDVRIFTRALNGDFGSQRNFGLNQATQDWIVMIDSDEELSPALASAIEQAVQHPTHDAYRCWIHNACFNTFTKSRLVRPIIFQRHLRFDGTLHEHIKRRMGFLNGALIHHSWTTTHDFFMDMIHYSRMQADMWYAKNPHHSRLYIWLRTWLTIPYIFTKVWLYEGKWRLGILGIMYAIMFAISYLFTALYYIDLQITRS